MVVADDRLEARERPRSGPNRPTAGLDPGLRRARLVPGLEVVESQVQVLVFEGAHGDEATACPVPDRGVVVVEGGEAEPLEGIAFGKRAECAADLEGLLVVRLGLRIGVAVVVADVDLAIIPREHKAAGDPDIRRTQIALTLFEDRPLEAVAVDSFHEVEERRLLLANAHPGPVRRDLVEVHLTEGVLQSEERASVQVAAGGGGRQTRPDVRSDPVADPVGDVPGDADIRPADLETAQVDRILVGVRDLGRVLVGVIREDRNPDLDEPLFPGLRRLRGPQEYLTGLVVFEVVVVDRIFTVEDHGFAGRAIAEARDRLPHLARLVEGIEFLHQGKDVNATVLLDFLIEHCLGPRAGGDRQAQ